MLFFVYFKIVLLPVISISFFLGQGNVNKPDSNNMPPY